MSKRKPTRRQRAVSSCATPVRADSSSPIQRPASASNTSRVEIFRDGVDTGYLGDHPNWWFDPTFEHSFTVFDLDGFYEGTYFQNDHVGPRVVKNYVDHVLFYGREFLGRDVQSVLELGCGGGWFTEEFLRRGLDVQAVEGSREGYEHALRRGVPAERITRHDLRQPLDMARTFDIAVCTEVAEHIECPFASQLIASITRHARVAWFSFEEPATNAAHYHHCNEQPARFWEQLFRYYGREPLWLPAEVMASVELRGNAVFHTPDMVVTDALKRASSPVPVKVSVRNAQADTVRTLAAQLRAKGLPVKLHLGCGYRVMDGYINIDLYTPAADVQLDITDLSCLEDNSVDEIYLNAVFEHLFGFEHRKALGEWRRILKPGGRLVLDSLPDFDELVRAYINEAPGNSGGTFDIEEVSRYTHGAPGEHNKFGQIHKDVFSKEKITRLLEGAGFEISEMKNVHWNDEPNPVNLNISAVKAEAARQYTPERERPQVSGGERFAPLAAQQPASFAAAYCVYDDAAWLPESVESVYDCCTAIYVMVSDRPWNGDTGDCSETLDMIAKLRDQQKKLRLVRGSWATEAEQRNAGLDMVREDGHGYCLVIDADEIYDPTDLRRMMEIAAKHPEVDCWHVAMDTYWKSWRYRVDPREPLKPAVFVRSGSAWFTQNRNLSDCPRGFIGPEAGFCHHLSYARSDEQLLRKISTFSHADEVRSGWYENVWKRWDSDHSMRNLHPTHPAAYGCAVEQPYWALPPVLRAKWDAEEGKSEAAPMTSIVILARNQLDYTRKCIESIERCTPEPHETVIVDNGSTDGTADYLAKLAGSQSNVRVIHSDTNLGFAGGNNRGIEASRGDYVVLLNNDVVVTPRWLERMLACVARSPEVGIVGPMTNCVSGPQLVEQPLYDTGSLGGLEQFSAEWAGKYHREVLPFWRTVGFCMLVRRAVIDKIGGLDARFGLGNFEDDDFCVRAQVAGYKCVIAHDSFVHHFGSRTFAGEKVDYKGLLAKNWEIYKQKWGIQPDVRYGAPYDLSAILRQPFDPVRHYCAVSQEQKAESGELGQRNVKPKAKGRGREAKRPKLSLCMIARNEEEFIAGCLESARGIVDEIVVVDTGSTDRTPEIVKSFGGKVYTFEWNDDYSAARNEALKHVTGDWTLMLDADERLDPQTKGLILSAISNSGVDAYELVFHNFCRDGSAAPDIVHRVCRLFRNRPEYRFEGRIHENVVPSIVATGGLIASLDAIVLHYGYQPDVKNRRNKHERYLALLEAELRDKPDDIYVLHHISAAHCAEEEFDQAIAYLEREVEIIPPNHVFAGQAFSRLTNALWATRRFEQALEVAERAHRKGIVHPEVTFSKANALLALERYEEAARTFEEAIRIGESGEWLGDPGTFGYKARFGVARAQAGLGNFARTAELCRAVVEERPSHGHAHEVLALACEQIGSEDEAEAEWNEVLRLKPDHYDALLHLATFAETAGRLDQAESYYMKALEQRSDDVRVLSDLGRVHAAQDKVEEALACFAKAVEIDPTYANAYFNAGDTLYAAGLYMQAADVYQNGLTVQPNNAAGFFTLGNCCFQVGAFDAAAAAYSQALAIRPDYDEAAANLEAARNALQQQAA